MHSESTERIKKIKRNAGRDILRMWIYDVSFAFFGAFFIFYSYRKGTPMDFDESHDSVMFYTYIVAACLVLFSIGLRFYYFSNKQIKAYFANGKEPDLEIYVRDHKTNKINYDVLEDLKQMTTFEKKILALPEMIRNRLLAITLVNAGIVMSGMFTRSYLVIIAAFFLYIIKCPLMLNIEEKAHKLLKE